MSLISPIDLDSEIAACKSAKDALRRLNVLLGRSDERAMAYAFMVHPQGAVRNDVIFATTAIPQWTLGIFRRVGGFATDVVFSRIGEIQEPFWIDNQEMYEIAAARGDVRSRFFAAVRKSTGSGGWICPILGADVQGFGVLNHLYKDRCAWQQEITPAELLELAYAFHQGVRRHGLLAREIRLSPKEVDALAHVVRGRSNQDIASDLGISQRAVEFRLQNCRKKLRARNIAEAVHRAHAYGVLNTVRAKA